MTDDVPRDAESRHYSYAHYADPGVAAAFDERRFGGPIGRMLVETQERILQSALAPLGGRRILDVGTGTGRAALALARAGAVVTGVDASREMLSVANTRAREAAVDVTFEVADAHALPFPDRSMDAAVCLRLLMHVPDWPRVVAELCRIARATVIVDFPARLSAAAIESAARRRAARAGRPTEPYRVIAEREVVAALRAGGFSVTEVHRQFVLPIALHKALRAPGLTRATEGALAAVGLRRLLGSPVTMVAVR